MGHAAKIAKYLLFITLLFSFVSLAHLVFAYIYHDANVLPEKGGTVSVGVVGDVPSLNPLRFGLGGSNDMMLGFLYRSLLRYDIVSRQLAGDLANCDLGKNFGLVKCYPNPENTWQDGSAISKEDILHTFAMLRKSQENASINAILDKVSITDRGDYIEFSTENPDTEIVSLLTFPIIAASAGDNPVSKTSGTYMLSDVTTDEDYGSTNVTLVRNESLHSDSPIYIGRYVFRFFSDEPSLHKNEEILDLLIGGEGFAPPVSPRFVRTNTLFPDQIALFLNAEKVPKSIRNLMLFQLGRTAVTNIDPSRGRILSDMFFSETWVTTELAERNIAKTYADLGFYTRDRLVELSEQEIAALEGSATGTVTTAAEPIPTLSSFDTPSRDAIHFSTGTVAGEIVIGGTVPAGVSGVFVNGYKLAKFSAGQTRFSYLARVSMGNLAEGTNTYKLSFEYPDGSRKDVETLVIHYSADPEKLSSMRTQALAERKPTISAMDPAEMQKRLSTLKQSLEQARELDPKYYYNRDFIRFTVDLLYTNQSGISPVLVDNIRDSLQMVGMYVNSREIDLAEIREIVRTGEKKYDALLTGINLGISGYNVFPFFHSGQAKGGLNFSGIRNIQLDIELERLKTRMDSGEWLGPVRNSVSTILAQEWVVRPYYSAYANWYIDRTIRGRLDVPVIPSAAFLHELLESAFVSERYNVDWETKNPLDFIRWSTTWLERDDADPTAVTGTGSMNAESSGTQSTATGINTSTGAASDSAEKTDA